MSLDYHVSGHTQTRSGASPLVTPLPGMREALALAQSQHYKNKHFSMFFALRILIDISTILQEDMILHMCSS